MPAASSTEVAVPWSSPRVSVAATLIGFASTAVCSQRGIVDVSTSTLLAKSSGYKIIMLDPDTVSGRLTLLPIQANTQLTQ